MNSRNSGWKAQSLPCPCGNSHDAYAINQDDWGTCFSCGKRFPPNEKEQQMVETVSHSHSLQMDQGNRGNRRTNAKVIEAEMAQDTYKYQYLPYRGVSKDVWQFFGCKTAISEKTGEPAYIAFPYPNGRTLNKRLDRKEFFYSGQKTSESGALFGMDKFPANSAKAITITEGALDAASIYQMFGKKYPVVSVASASSAKSDCAREYEYLNSFEKIYLCFDNDTPGREAASAVARLFDFNKVYVVNLVKKDANDYLTANEAVTFEKLWWSARRFLPEGILSSYGDFDRVIDEDVLKPSIPYPFPRLQEMTYGARTGELVLLTAQEGIGKTEIFRALEYHFLKTTDENIGIVHLEESKARTIKGLVGYEVKRPIHLPDFAIPKDEIKKTFRALTKKDERVHVYSHFGSDDPDVILSTIRFLAGSCNCKRIFLDHITMVVSGLAGDDERRALDYISTRLAMMVEELDFTLFMISHVNDEGQTRGSRNIGKVADLRIDMHRDLKAVDDRTRNTTWLTVSKNRFAGKTGPAGALLFDHETYCLEETDPDAEVLPF